MASDIDAGPDKSCPVLQSVVTLVGFAVYLSGYETFFFTFYLLALFLATWRLAGCSVR